MTVKVDIENKTIIRVLFIVMLFIMAVNFISAVGYALTLIGVAIFLALALNPPVTYLSSKITKGSRGAATGIAYVVVLTVIGLFLSTFIPPLVEQTGNFLDKVPDYVNEFSSGDGFIQDFIDRYELDSEINELGRNLASQIGDTNGPIFSGINRVGSAIVSVLTVLVLTFFMLVEGPMWLDKMWRLQPSSKRQHRKELARKMYHVVTGYVNGQLLIATIAAFSSLIMMIFVGLDFALPLAGLVGLFGLIPLVGATLGSAVVITVALFDSVATAVAMLIFFLVYQQVENNFIQPYIQSRTLDVSPLLILVAVLFGIGMGGLLGGFIAIPAAACVKILLNDYLENSGRKRPKKA